jgi:hypothetical protein
MMNKAILLACLAGAGCCCFDRGGDDSPPPLPLDDRPGGRLEQAAVNILRPDLKYDPYVRPPFTYEYPEPRITVAPRAEDPSWKNR